jgi:hypothetical protein
MENQTKLQSGNVPKASQDFEDLALHEETGVAQAEWLGEGAPVYQKPTDPRLSFAPQGVLHEIGARVGLVQPTIGEEIKFGAEKIGGPKTLEKLQELDARGHLNAVPQSEFASQGILHEIGARTGLVEPTIGEEIKIRAEQLRGDDPRTVMDNFQNDVEAKTRQAVADTKEKAHHVAQKVGSSIPADKIKENAGQAWDGTKGKAHELGARAGLVEPTLREEIKIGAESIKTGTTQEKLEELDATGRVEPRPESDRIHELDARKGFVEPTAAEKIKFEAEHVADKLRTLKDDALTKLQGKAESLKSDKSK